MPTQADLEQLGENLKSREWRLRNLYWIQNERGERVLFQPNWAQVRLLDDLRLRNVVLKVRQIGATTGFCVLWLDTILWNRNTRIGLIAHTKEDAKIIFRDKVKYPYESLPAEIRAYAKADKCDAGELLLNNGSGIRVGVSFRSGTVQILHVTELGYICQYNPQRALEIKTGAFQAVKDGMIVVEATARGRSGDFFNLCQEAQKRPEAPGALDWKFSFLPWFHEPTYAVDEQPFAEAGTESEYLNKVEVESGQKLSKAQRQWWCRKRRDLGDDVFAEFPSTPEEAFRQNTEGAYYGKRMLEAWQSGRVTTVPVDPSLLVETWWDLGMRDQNAIWFVQRNGYEIRLVDYYENSGEGLPHYAAYLDTWREKHKVRFGRHVGPHDLRVRDYGTGVSRLDAAAKLGITFDICPDIALIDGIEAVRSAIPRCVFDEEHCGQGIHALEHYRKEWDEALGVFKSQPLHDWAEHGASAFRMGIVGGSKVQLVPRRSAAREVKVVRWK